MINRLHPLGIAVALLIARGASAQSPNPLGTWRGTSTCLVRPSACNDEVVVYRITRMRTADSLSIDARKIVRGEEQDMGTLSCRLEVASGQITCVIPRGTWRFRVHGDSLTGDLRLPDSTRFRDVRTLRGA